MIEWNLWYIVFIYKNEINISFKKKKISSKNTTAPLKWWQDQINLIDGTNPRFVHRVGEERIPFLETNSLAPSPEVSYSQNTFIFLLFSKFYVLLPLFVPDG